MVELFATRLEDAARSLAEGAQLVIVVDGLDQLDETQALDFLHGDSAQVWCAT